MSKIENAMPRGLNLKSLIRIFDCAIERSAKLAEDIENGHVPESEADCAAVQLVKTGIEALAKKEMYSATSRALTVLVPSRHASPASKTG